MSNYVQDNMKTIRLILGYTQLELCEVLGISRPTIIKIEKGLTEIPRAITISFIAFVICNYKRLDKSSKTYELISIYIDDFEDELINIVISK